MYVIGVYNRINNGLYLKGYLVKTDKNNKIQLTSNIKQAKAYKIRKAAENLANKSAAMHTKYNERGYADIEFEICIRHS